MSLGHGLMALGSAEMRSWAVERMVGGTWEAGQGHGSLLVPSGLQKSVLILPHFILIEWILLLCSKTQNRVISNDTALSFRHFLKHFRYFDHVLFSYFKVNSSNLSVSLDL